MQITFRHNVNQIKPLYTCKTISLLWLCSHFGSSVTCRSFNIFLKMSLNYSLLWIATLVKIRIQCLKRGTDVPLKIGNFKKRSVSLGNMDARKLHHLLEKFYQWISTSAERSHQIISLGTLELLSTICLASNTSLLCLWSCELWVMIPTLLWGFSSTRTKVPWNLCFFSKRWLLYSTYLQKRKHWDYGPGHWKGIQ